MKGKGLVLSQSTANVGMRSDKRNTPTYFIKIYGCLFNHADAQRVRTILNNAGYKEVFRQDEADYVVVLTCSVREKAEHKVISYAQKVKQINPDARLLITGCMVRRDYLDTDNRRTLKRIKRLEKVIPQADFFMDITNVDKLPRLFSGELNYKELVLNRDPTKSYMDLVPIIKPNEVTASIPIMTGCNEFCTYCIVPYTRGKEQYRSFDSILEEVEAYLKQGTRIIYLLGQIVDKWQDTSRNMKFIDLLRAIDNLDYDFFFSFTSPHPTYISREVLEFIRDGKHIMKHLGLPLQSGSNKVLKAMNRRYTREQYLDIARMARDIVPNLYLTTDIIVGFPPEDEEDFQQTLEIVEQLQFDKVFFAKYSPRHEFHKDIVHNVEYQKTVQERFDRLNELVSRIFAERNKAQVGNTYRAVIVSESQAVSERNQVVDIPDNDVEPGKIVGVRIIGGGRRGVIGEIVEVYD